MPTSQPFQCARIENQDKGPTREELPDNHPTAELEQIASDVRLISHPGQRKPFHWSGTRSTGFED